MDLPPPAAAAARPSPAAAPGLAALVIALFFIWGGATSLNDVLIPKLRALYALSTAQAMLTQFAFFTAYFVVSLPAGALVARVGYLRGLVVGLAVTAAGALMFWPAAAGGAYGGFLVALFVLAGGITILQVASNPTITLLGPAATASSRLTFAQAFNSLGTTVWPYVGANLLLGGTLARTDPATLAPAARAAFRVRESAVVAHVYLGIAAVLVAMAAVFWAWRHALSEERPPAPGLRETLALLALPGMRFGVLAIFCYVGAEVSIGSLLVVFLEQPGVMGLDPRAAGEHLALYWGGAMVGRFVGAALLRRVRPAVLLALVAAVAGALALAAAGTGGPVAGWALLAVGLFNSIMFPTIFSLSVEGLGERTAEASGLLCMAIVGGAVVPLVTGRVADATSLAAALAVPAACYAVIVAFALTRGR